MPQITQGQNKSQLIGKLYKKKRLNILYFCRISMIWKLKSETKLAQEVRAWTSTMAAPAET